MLKLFEFLKPYIPMLLCATVLLVVEAWLALELPSYMADIIDEGVLPGHLSVIWRNGGIMMGITVFSVVLALFTGFFTARTATGVANDLREAVFNKVLRFSNAEIDRFSTSSLITRTTNDIMQIQTALMMTIRQFIYAPVLAAGGIIRALERSTELAWIVILATTIMLVLLGFLYFIALPKFKIWQNLIDRVNLVTRENLSGILVVRAFSTQKFEKKRFSEANKTLAETERFVNVTFAFMTPIINLVMNLTTALIVWIGAHQASAFRVDIGDMFAFLQYGMLIIFAFLMISITFIMIPRAVVCANRIQEVLETEGSIKIKENPLPLPVDFKGTVEFRNVDFRYPKSSVERMAESKNISSAVTADDENVLTGISFTAKPGETTAIIGATGAGKSTILKLILRFFDVTGGGIYLDGIDIRDIYKEELHDKIGYVAQKAVLFKGSIRSNLLYANKQAAEEVIIDAVDTAQSADFIAGKQGGYEFEAAQGGANFSGGQKQRLNIARALVKNAPIYMFDDSFSALDLKTDSLLRSALKKKMSSRTIIIVAQRISTTMDADQIIVLDNGKIAGLGKHEELMQSCEVYKEIAASQLSKEEMGLG